MSKKELYRFPIKYNKKNYNIVVYKPNLDDLEEVSFFYGQKYNEYIRKGFLTRAMMSKKYGELGSEEDMERIHNALRNYYEAEKVITLYDTDESKLNDEQRERLNNAKNQYIEVQHILNDYQLNIRAQMSQTADVLAEQKLIEWLVFFFSHYEENFEGKTEIFPLFKGNNFDEKRSNYLKLADEDYESNDSEFKKAKELMAKSFEKIVKILTLWYGDRKISSKDIKDALKE